MLKWPLRIHKNKCCERIIINGNKIRASKLTNLPNSNCWSKCLLNRRPRTSKDGDIIMKEQKK